MRAEGEERERERERDQLTAEIKALRTNCEMCERNASVLD